jgi:hypothetical protein
MGVRALTENLKKSLTEAPVEDIADLLDDLDAFDLDALEMLGSKLEDAVEALPGHGGQAGYHARDVAQTARNLKTTLRELRRHFGG